jgi:hypothetical protein
MGALGAARQLLPYWRIEPRRRTVLVTNPAPTPAAAGKPKVTYASTRPRDRRGHPRHLRDERMVWVKPLQWRDEERPKPAAVTFDDQLAELWAAGATLSESGSSLAEAAPSLLEGSLGQGRVAICDSRYGPRLRKRSGGLSCWSSSPLSPSRSALRRSPNEKVSRWSR